MADVKVKVLKDCLSKDQTFLKAGSVLSLSKKEDKKLWDLGLVRDFDEKLDKEQEPTDNTELLKKVTGLEAEKSALDEKVTTLEAENKELKEKITALEGSEVAGLIEKINALDETANATNMKTAIKELKDSLKGE